MSEEKLSRMVPYAKIDDYSYLIHRLDGLPELVNELKRIGDLLEVMLKKEKGHEFSN